MAVQFYEFGKLPDGRSVTAAKLTNHAGASLTVLDYGATVQALCIPDRDGKPVDVVLGYDTAEEYLKNGDYLGATIGRVGNRIGKAEFSLNGKTYILDKNDGENHLHGGKEGFDKKFWRMAAQDESLLCWRTSPDGEENYPGNLKVQVLFRLTEDNRFCITYDADTDADTLVNLTNHSYFNLSGGGSVLTEKEIGADIGAENEQLKRAGGYDHNYVLCGAKAAVLYSPETGIEMTVETDLPGMQLYSGNFLTPRKGKGGSVIDKRYAACFETQLYPNAMNCYGFPSPVLRAGAHLHSETSYAFRVR